MVFVGNLQHYFGYGCSPLLFHLDRVRCPEKRTDRAAAEENDRLARFVVAENKRKRENKERKINSKWEQLNLPLSGFVLQIKL